MKVSREEKMTEAIERMKLLKIFPETINQFKEGMLSVSEPPFGAFYWLEGEELELVHKFEKKHNALVYVVVRSFTAFGKMDSYLYVGDYKEEWERDREELENGAAFAYVHNYLMTDCSEFGSIGIRRTLTAGLQRI